MGTFNNNTLWGKILNVVITILPASNIRPLAPARVEGTIDEKREFVGAPVEKAHIIGLQDIMRGNNMAVACINTAFYDTIIHHHLLGTNVHNCSQQEYQRREYLALHYIHFYVMHV